MRRENESQWTVYNLDPTLATLDIYMKRLRINLWKSATKFNNPVTT
jgi:hypothetical protein